MAERIEASAKNVMKELMKSGDKLTGAICNKGTLQNIIDVLDQACTKKGMKKQKLWKASEQIEKAITESNPESREEIGYEEDAILDLTGKKRNGSAWNFTEVDDQTQAKELFDEATPKMLKVSIPDFETLIKDISQITQKAMTIKALEVIKYAKFVVGLCQEQARLGRQFLLERKAGIMTVGAQVVNKLYFVKDMVKVNVNMLTDECSKSSGTRPGKIRSILTNSKLLQRTLAKKCMTKEEMYKIVYKAVTNIGHHYLCM